MQISFNGLSKWQFDWEKYAFCCLGTTWGIYGVFSILARHEERHEEKVNFILNRLFLKVTVTNMK